MSTKLEHFNTFYENETENFIEEITFERTEYPQEINTIEPLPGYTETPGEYDDTTEKNTTVIDHNSVDGIQGGNEEERYHLTAEELSKIHDAATVKGSPLSISGQEIEFKYSTSDFEIDESGNLSILSSGASTGTQYTAIANQTLEAYKVVKTVSGLKVDYASNLTLTDANIVVGITTAGALEAANVIVHTFGEIENLSWTWNVNQPIFLSTGGSITQSVPSSGYQLILGWALSETKIFFKMQMPIVLV